MRATSHTWPCGAFPVASFSAVLNAFSNVAVDPFETPMTTSGVGACWLAAVPAPARSVAANAAETPAANAVGSFIVSSFESFSPPAPRVTLLSCACGYNLAEGELEAELRSLALSRHEALLAESVRELRLEPLQHRQLAEVGGSRVAKRLRRAEEPCGVLGRVPCGEHASEDDEALGDVAAILELHVHGEARPDALLRELGPILEQIELGEHEERGCAVQGLAEPLGERERLLEGLVGALAVAAPEGD